MGATVYLDSNIFIRAFEGSDALTGALIDLMAVNHGGDLPAFATSELTLAEMLVHPYRLNDEPRRQRYEDLILPSTWLQVGPVNRDVLAAAALLRSSHSLKLPDAIHVSTTLHFGCQFILTSDIGIKGNYRLNYKSMGESWADRSLSVVRAEFDQILDLTKSLHA